MSLKDGRVYCDYCGGWNWPPTRPHACPGCGTVYNDKGQAVDIGPARRMGDNLISQARSHFNGIHQQLRTIERLLRHLMKSKKVKLPKGRPPL